MLSKKLHEEIITVSLKIETGCNQPHYLFWYSFETPRLSFRTDRSGQTVQTHIRLLLRSSLIRVYTACNSGCIFWMHYFKPSCLTFRVITASFCVSEILGVLQYHATSAVVTKAVDVVPKRHAFSMSKPSR